MCCLGTCTPAEQQHRRRQQKWQRLRHYLIGKRGCVCMCYRNSIISWRSGAQPHNGAEPVHACDTHAGCRNEERTWKPTQAFDWPANPTDLIGRLCLVLFCCCQHSHSQAHHDSHRSRLVLNTAGKPLSSLYGTTFRPAVFRGCCVPFVLIMSVCFAAACVTTVDCIDNSRTRSS